MSRTTASTSPRRWLSPALLLWLALGFMTIWVIGAHVDAWYHVHHGFEIESFFTWTHALLYGGAAGTGVVVAPTRTMMALTLLDPLGTHQSLPPQWIGNGHEHG